MDQIERAIEHLNAQDRPCYASAARLFRVQETTLRRRFLRLTVSRQQAAQETHQLLNTAQEDVLLSYIDRLTDKHIPPTTQIVRNLAEEILNKDVGKNWAAGFVERYKDRICSIYLRPLDKARVASENTAMFTHFYTLVLFIFAVFRDMTNKMLVE